MRLRANAGRSSQKICAAKKHDDARLVSPFAAPQAQRPPVHARRASPMPPARQQRNCPSPGPAASGGAGSATITGIDHAVARGQERGGRGRRVPEPVHLQEQPARRRTPRAPAPCDHSRRVKARAAYRHRPQRQHRRRPPRSAPPGPDRRQEPGESAPGRSRELRQAVSALGQRETQAPQPRGAPQPRRRVSAARDGALPADPAIPIWARRGRAKALGTGTQAIGRGEQKRKGQTGSSSVKIVPWSSGKTRRLNPESDRDVRGAHVSCFVRHVFPLPPGPTMALTARGFTQRSHSRPPPLP